MIKTSQIKQSRQRRPLEKGKVEEYAKDIAQRGLIHTVLVEKDSDELIAGAHRLAAFELNARRGEACAHPEFEGWTRIPARFAFNATEQELEALMLVENLKRLDLGWEEQVRSIRRFHDIGVKSSPEWNLTKTAEALGFTTGYISKYLVVANELEKGNARVSKATNITSAYNIVHRGAERAIADELNLIDEVQQEESGEEEPPQESILCLDYLEWLKVYEGPKFNLLHCDFPYGINHQKSEQGRAAEWGEYNDTPDIFFQLLKETLSNLDRILFPSAHILFWFSMNFYSETVSLLEKSGLEVNRFPLIWFKSDGKGILPDPERGPRRIYETCLLISRGDRKIIQAVSNLYAAGGTKEQHLSEKPESVLRYFMSMLVDSNTEMLDPTCGSGTALRAAEFLGAKRVLGIERIPEFVEGAKSSLLQSRHMQKLSKGAKS